jgi:hypothetical protein
MDISDYANETPPSSALGPITTLLREEELPSPIDTYRRSKTQILIYGTEPRLQENDFIGRLLTLGLVAAAEAFPGNPLSLH